jgi:hypothetical protein
MPGSSHDPLQAIRDAERRRHEAERRRQQEAEEQRRRSLQQAETERQQFRALIEIKLKDQPHEVLRLLVNLRPGFPGEPILKRDEQARFARRAIQALAERIDAEKDAWKALSWVRTVGLERSPDVLRRDLGEDVVWILGSMDNRLERRGLAALFEAVRQRAEAGQWSEAGARALAVPPPSVRTVLAQTKWRMPEAAAKALNQVSHLARFQAAMAQLGTLLNQLEPAPPAAPTSFASVVLDPLPTALANDLRGLRSLLELPSGTRELGKARPTSGSLADLKRRLADLRYAGIEVGLAAEAQQDLAVQLFLAGHATEARSMLPTKGPTEHAAELLADLKAIILNQGEVTTAPARQMLDADAHGAGVDMPPGLRPLMASANGNRWHAPRNSAPAKASALERIALGTKPQRDRVVAGIEPARATFLEQSAACLLQACTLTAQYQVSPEAERADAQLVSDLKGELKRDLTLAELDLARQLRSRGKSIADIGAAIRRFNPPESQVRAQRP